MQKTVLSFLFIMTLVSYTESTIACDCMGDKITEGFYSDFGTQNLPLNTKGVLFFVKSEGSNLPAIYNKLHPSHFSFKDLKSGKELPTRLKILKMERVQGYWKYVFYRLEPIDGFKAGHEYEVRLKEEPAWKPSLYKYILNVKIDNVVIKRSDLLKAKFLPDGTPTVESVKTADTSGFLCSEELESKVQKMKFQLPARLEAYKDAIRYFVQYQTGTDKHLWVFRDSICGKRPDFGRSGFETGHDMLFIPSENMKNSLQRNKKYKITGSWVFPEVDATVFESTPYEFSYPR